MKKRESHNMYNTRIYHCWVNMKGRCYREKTPYYKNYGGRGIKVCEEWKNSFLEFYEWAMKNDYSDGKELDRVDVDGDYEPQNCRWLTHKQQQFNKRTNRLITYNGETLTLTEMAEKYTIPYQILQTRITKLKWSHKKAIETPVGIKKRFVVEQYDFQGKIIGEWESLREIERCLGFPHSNIKKAIEKNKKYKECFWKKKAEIEVK